MEVQDPFATPEIITCRISPFLRPVQSADTHLKHRKEWVRSMVKEIIRLYSQEIKLKNTDLCLLNKHEALQLTGTYGSALMITRLSLLRRQLQLLIDGTCSKHPGKHSDVYFKGPGSHNERNLRKHTLPYVPHNYSYSRLLHTYPGLVVFLLSKEYPFNRN